MYTRGLNGNYFLDMSFLESYEASVMHLVGCSNCKYTEVCVGLTRIKKLCDMVH